MDFHQVKVKIIFGMFVGIIASLSMGLFDNKGKGESEQLARFYR